jgi:hypothetical protein
MKSLCFVKKGVIVDRPHTFLDSHLITVSLFYPLNPPFVHTLQPRACTKGTLDENANVEAFSSLVVLYLSYSPTSFFMGGACIPSPRRFAFDSSYSFSQRAFSRPCFNLGKNALLRAFLLHTTTTQTFIFKRTHYQRRYNFVVAAHFRQSHQLDRKSAHNGPVVAC